MKVDYSKAKIYKIVDNTNDNIYIGSTCQPLRKRLSSHKSKSECRSREIIINSNYDIILIEDYPCLRKEQLHARERYYIENTKCINKQIPGRTKKESQKNWDENNKERIKEYYEKYKERKLLLGRIRRAYKRDCDYLCNIDIYIFQ